MIVKVLLFAGAADIVGRRDVQIDLLEGLSIEELSRALGVQYPALVSLLKISRWAIDRQFVSHDTIVDPSQEIALIPPVSGG